MKKKLVVLLSLTLSVLFALSGCNLFGSKVVIYQETEKTVSNILMVSELSNYSVSTSRGPIVVLQNEDNYKIYNVDAEKVILTLQKGEDIYYDFDIVNENAFMVTRTRYTNNYSSETYSYFYDSNGSVVASVEGYAGLENFLDIYSFDLDFYRLNDNGGFEELSGLSYSFYDDLEYARGEYYYATSSETIITYDKNFNVVNYHRAPSYAQGISEIIILDNGNYVYQYEYNVDPLTEKYDYLDEDNVKYNLETVLVDISKNKVKDIDTDYIFGSGLYVEEITEEGIVIDEKYKTLIEIVTKIENKKLSRIDYKMMSINGKGKMEEIKPMIEYGQALVYTMSNGNYYTYTIAGELVVLDEDFKELKRFNERTIDFINNSLISINKKIYDANMNLVKDISEYDIVKVLSDCVILRSNSDDTYYCVRADGTQTGTETLINYEGTLIDGYLIEGIDGYMSFYNGAGKLVGTINGGYASVTASSSNYQKRLIRVSGHGDEYYYLAK